MPPRGVARGGGEKAPRGVEAHGHEQQEDRLGAERQRGPGDESRDEEAEISQSRSRGTSDSEHGGSVRSAV